MLDHAGLAAFPSLRDPSVHDAALRRLGDRCPYVALIGRENPLSSMRRGG